MKFTFAGFFLHLVLLVKTTTAKECESRYSEYGYQLKGSSFLVFVAESVGKCYEVCLGDSKCNSINYDLRTSVCDQNYLTKTAFPWMFVRKEGTIYAEAKFPDYGASAQVPAPSCKFIKETKPDVQSGIYWIKLNQPRTLPFQVYCDMETDEGGWTLVYNYHFTNFTFFTNYKNAVTPIPSWHVKELPNNLAPVSKDAPLNEWTYTAIDFLLWKTIGDEILVKSTITHWISCSSGSGNFVNWKQGTVNCRMVKHVANVCLDVVPTKFQVISYCGPALRTDSNLSVFFFDGSIRSCYPTHDPCGTSQVGNYRTGVEIPKGSVYIR